MQVRSDNAENARHLRKHKFSPMFLPRLYSFRRCPYAIRARLALAYSNIQVDMVEVDLRAKPAALLALSPKGTVPVLQLPSGAVLEQSLDIMHWALERHDPERWNDDASDSAELIHICDQELKPALDIYKYQVRHAPAQVADAHREIARITATFERRIAANGQLIRSATSLADAAIFPFVRQLFGATQTRETWQTPALSEWLEKWKKSALFHSVMQ
jgi:glutathione S-transferase